MKDRVTLTAHKLRKIEYFKIRLKFYQEVMKYTHKLYFYNLV